MEAAKAAKHYRFVEVPDPRPPDIPPEHVHELTAAQKDAVFGDRFAEYKSRDVETQATLDRLRAYSPAVAACFSSKASRTADFTFRLISPTGRPLDAPQPEYVTVSYRWPQHGAGLPFSPLLWTAMLSEMRPEEEGLWLDQLCINQADLDEKSVSIGLMDLVYERSRCTFVPLADVDVSASEKECLKTFKPKPQAPGPPALTGEDSTQDDYRDLLGLYAKLVQSEYFQRVWTSHEVRVTQSPRFFMPCTADNTALICETQLIVELIWLGEVRHSRPEGLRERHVSCLRDTIMSSMLRQFYRDDPSMGKNTLLVDAYRSMEHYQAGGDASAPSQDPHRKRTAWRDKIAVILNIVHSNFTLRPEPYAPSAVAEEDPADEHIRKFCLLALARKEAFVLCGGGLPLPRVMPGDSYSWMRRPWNLLQLPLVAQDYELADEQTVMLCPEEAERYIELDMVPLEPRAQAPVPRAVRMAETIQRELLGLGADEKARLPTVSAWRDLFHPGNERRNAPCISFFHETIGCILQLGLDWLWRSALDLPDRPDNLMRNLVIAGLSPLKESTEAPSEMFSAERDPLTSLAQILEEPAGRTLDRAAFLRAMDTVVAYAWSLNAADVPHGFRPATADLFHARLLTLGWDSSPRHLTLLSPTQVYADGAVRPLLIPAALLPNQYSEFHRVWTTDRARIDGAERDALLEQSRVVGPALRDLPPSRRMRVWGPPRDRAQLLDPGQYPEPGVLQRDWFDEIGY